MLQVALTLICCCMSQTDGCESMRRTTSAKQSCGHTSWPLSLARSLLLQGGPRNTSEGTDLTNSAGVIPRAIHQIFSILDANEAEYTVKCSFLELYNEETTDLLAVGDAMDQKLKMLEDSGRVVVQASAPCWPRHCL